MRIQIVKDIIRLMEMGIDVSSVQRMINNSYGIYVQSHGLWKIYHTYRGI